MRLEFSKTTKEAGYDRCKIDGVPHCEDCRLPLGAERPEYHHILEAWLGGDNSLENCQVVHYRCHKRLTKTQSIPRVAKVRRIEAKNAGIRPRGRKIPSRPFNQERW
jgi:5-methylcytosine-specific restriction protein A